MNATSVTNQQEQNRVIVSRTWRETDRTFFFQHTHATYPLKFCYVHPSCFISHAKSPRFKSSSLFKRRRHKPNLTAGNRWKSLRANQRWQPAGSQLTFCSKFRVWRAECGRASSRTSHTSAKKNATLSASRKNAQLLALPSQTSFPSGATVFLSRVWLKLHNRESYYPLSHVTELETSTSKASRITELVNFYLDIQNYNFACCFVWVRKLDFHIQAGT
jgi:hypothetical protein